MTYERSAKWQDHLTSEVYDRLCDCTSTKDDMIELTRAYYLYEGKMCGMSVESCLDYMLEWVLDWNGGTWYYTEEELNSWINTIRKTLD